MTAGKKEPISERFTGGPKLLAAAVAAALCGTAPLPADAAGLGRLTVQSALGQPLRAEVEVTALGREEIGSLTARLAPPEAFRQAGLEYNPALGSLRFAIEQRPNGSAIVHVTSTQPVNEPFVDLLVELNWASGKFVREYTFLLDPPELRMGRDTLVAGGAATSAPSPAARNAAAAPAAGTAAPARAPVSVAPVNSSNAAVRAAPTATSAASSNVAAPTATPSATSAGGAGAPAAVRVQTGDTLAKIATQVKPADVSVEQAIMAIYRANPRAFFGTVHQLLSGAELKIPDVAQMKAIDTADARREIRAQAAEFNAYRARLASAARSVEPTKAGQTAEGSVAARAEQSSPPAASGDQLKLSRSAGATASAGSATGAAAPSNAEMQVANDAALREQQERVSALERNVADLQQLVELKNRQLAELQRQVETARAAGATASGTIASATQAAPAAAPTTDAQAAQSGSTAPASATSPAASAVASDTSASAASSPAVSEAPASSPAPAEAVSATDTNPSAADSTTAAVSHSAPAAQADVAPTPAPAPASTTAPTPAPEPGVLAALMDNPLALPALIAIALGLGAFGVYSARRRRKGEEGEDTLSSADAFTANSLFGSTGGQSVDTHASLFASSERDSGVDVHSTEVDPIAEAEVYIAYGREAQAEEILKEALKRQPERQAIRLKLLEIHAARKDPIAFGALAQEMYDQAGGLNEEWAKVVTLGLAIDPANPLYTGEGAQVSTAQPVADHDTPAAAADEVPAIADLGHEADAAAAMFGEPGFDPAASAHRAFGESFAETVPMDGVNAASAADRASLEDEIPALDFDLDLETTVGRAGNALGARDAGRNDGASPGSALERAIDGRFELPSLDLDVASHAAVGDTGRDGQSHRSDEDIPALADLGDFEIDLPSLEGIGSRITDGDERPAVDLADLEGGGGLGNLDFSSVDLELSDGDVGLAAADTAVAPALAASSRWQEMATKLDLASAYEEIGDKEGARELLQEVLDGGDASQQQKARTMLAKIG